MMTAATRKGRAKKRSTVLPRARPRIMQAITRKRVIGFTLVAPCARSPRASVGLYVRLPSFSAQAVATAEFGALLPGMVAQPPFSMRARRSQDEETLLKATSFAAE